LPSIALSQDAVTLKYIATGAGDWEPILEKAFAAFTEETGINATFECYQHEQLFQVIEVKVGKGGGEYDVLAVDVPMVAGYVEKGYIIPMDKYFTQEEKDQFVDAAVQAGTWDGKFYAPPMNTSAQLLYYNKDFLSQAGFEIPEADPNNRLTWEQVYDMAEKTLQVVDPDKTKAISGISFEQISRAYQMLALPNSLGEKSIGDDGLTVDGVINTPGWIKAMTFLHDIFANGIGLRGTTANEQSDYFIAGKGIFHVGGSWNSNRITEDFEWGYTYCPAFEGYEDKVATPTGSWHFGIAADSKHPDEAAALIKFMTLGKGSDIWLDGNKDVPARKDKIEEILVDPKYDGFREGIFRIAAYEAANTAYPRPVTPAYAEYESLLNGTLEDIRNGADPATALDACVVNTNSIMNKYRD
jgi:fructooligosaccharide transport system substrate-binding protein